MKATWQKKTRYEQENNAKTEKQRGKMQSTISEGCIITGDRKRLGIWKWSNFRVSEGDWKIVRKRKSTCYGRTGNIQDSNAVYNFGGVASLPGTASVWVFGSGATTESPSATGRS